MLEFDPASMSWSELEKLMYGIGTNFDKIAFDRLTSARGAAKKLRNAFTTAFKKGESFDQLISRIQKITGSEISSAKRIARTEVTKIENLAQYRAAIEYKKRYDVPLMKTWICRFRNSRESHEFLHRSTVPLEADFLAYDGPMKYPGDDSRVGPQEIINCQCHMLVSTRAITAEDIRVISEGMTPRR